MTATEPDPALPEQWRRHAKFCADSGAPLYAELMRGLADDLDGGGPVARLLEGRLDARVPDVVQLRILGGLHRLVLQGDAPELAPWYAAHGCREPAGVWPVARKVIEEHLETLRGDLDHPPQTNEPGRAAALAVGLTVACAEAGTHRVRLLELGASAGLNLLVDQFHVTGEGWSWGPVNSPVQILGAVAAPLGRTAADAGLAAGPVPEIVQRRGCDLAPVDPVSEIGRLRLLSFVWPDHVERFRRVQHALDLAARTPVTVDRAPMGTWLDEQLAAAPDDRDIVTVVWHSIVMQYVDPAEKQRVADVLASAARRMPVVRLALEAPVAPYASTPELRLDGRLLATVAAHGVPVTLSAVSPPQR